MPSCPRQWLSQKKALTCFGININNRGRRETNSVKGGSLLDFVSDDDKRTKIQANGLIHFKSHLGDVPLISVVLCRRNSM